MILLCAPPQAAKWRNTWMWNGQQRIMHGGEEEQRHEWKEQVEVTNGKRICEQNDNIRRTEKRKKRREKKSN